MNEYGPIYRLTVGPRNFVVVSGPAISKHLLRNYGKYAKGLVTKVSEFLRFSCSPGIKKVYIPCLMPFER